MTSFKEFVDRYNDGSITDDAAWRAYNIEGMGRRSHAERAARYVLKPMDCELSLAYHLIASRYGLHTPSRARAMLAMWWVWRSIATGQRKRGELRDTSQGGLAL